MNIRTALSIIESQTEDGLTPLVDHQGTTLTILEAHEPKHCLLRELTGYKANQVIPTFKNAMKDVGDGYMSSDDRKSKLLTFLDALHEHGFVPVANGSFGAVFTHPGIDYVIKIFKDDQPYLAFLRYVASHQDNQHLPKLIGKVMNLGDGHFAIRVEHLKPLPSTAVRERYCEALESVLKSHPQVDADEFPALIDFFFSKSAKDKFVNAGAKALAREQPGLFSTMQELALAHLDGFDLDIHVGNFMMRGKTMVIIDPLADMSKIFSDLELAYDRGDI